MSKCVVYSGFSKHDGSKCLLHSAGKDFGPNHFANLRCFAASSRHLVAVPKKCKKKTVSDTYKLTTRTCMCLHVRVFDVSISNLLYFC